MLQLQIWLIYFASYDLHQWYVATSDWLNPEGLLVGIYADIKKGIPRSGFCNSTCSSYKFDVYFAFYDLYQWYVATGDWLNPEGLLVGFLLISKRAPPGVDSVTRVASVTNLTYSLVATGDWLSSEGLLIGFLLIWKRAFLLISKRAPPGVDSVTQVASVTKLTYTLHFMIYINDL